MSFSFSKRSLERMDGIDPRLIEIAHRALQISNIDFGIPEYGGIRTEDEQMRLCAAGKSKCDGVIRKSYHQSGKAIDVYAHMGTHASWDREHLAIVACAMLQAAAALGYPLEWGGNWKSWQDMPHFELRD